MSGRSANQRKKRNVARQIAPALSRVQSLVVFDDIPRVAAPDLLGDVIPSNEELLALEEQGGDTEFEYEDDASIELDGRGETATITVLEPTYERDPRVVLGDAVMDFIQDVVGNSASDTQGQTTQVVAEIGEYINERCEPALVALLERMAQVERRVGQLLLKD